MGIVLTVNKTEQVGLICSYGCGGIANYLLGKFNPRPCCSSHFQKCPWRIARSPLCGSIGEQGRIKGQNPRNLAKVRFGRLVAKSIKSYGPVVWNCQCDCGRTTPVRASALVNKNTKSCGCLRDEKVGNITRKRPYEHTYNAFRRSCGREVLITFEQFLGLVEIKTCHYCSVEIPWEKYHNPKKGYFLDRKNNAAGYTMGNVVVCCTRCNFGKSKFFSYEEWVEIGKCIKGMRERKALAQGA